MKSIVEAAMDWAAEYPGIVVMVGVAVLLVVGLPVAKQVREYWAPKIVGWRRRAGRVCQLIGIRLSGGEVTPTELAVTEEVRRLPERV
ncbi:hypothetical protein ACFWBN_31800 [Streptomyces sp. NPDC059989]|uniref:hypothetical protein n=1 Tax=Streptomyces sp. NPDC059989 TaxID=3347026 RepID=UPI0036C01A05